MRSLVTSFLIATIVAGLCIGMIGCESPGKPGESSRSKLHAKVMDTISTFRSRDPSITRFFDDSYGYAVYPSVGKGGFILGGAHGDGEVLQGGRVIGLTGLTKGSIGLQVGGQVFEEIVFFKDRHAMDAFKAGTFAFDAGASAVMVEAGAAVNTPYKSGVAVFVRSKAGMMAEVSVGGQGLSFEAD